jgi:hypothetical protein
MCVAKKPHIDESNSTKDRNPPILRNPILDGLLGNIAALRGGRNALRIDLLNPLAIPVGGGVGGGIAGGVGGTSSGGSSGGTTSTSSTSTSTSSGGGGGGTRDGRVMSF